MNDELTTKDLQELCASNVGKELLEHCNACKLCARLLQSSYELVARHIEETRILK